MTVNAMENPAMLRYSQSHEWMKEEGEHVVVIGITHHAQAQLGDIVFVELPAVGAQVSAGDEVVVVESVKTAADVYAPLTGEVIAVNEHLQQTPEHVNHAPFTEGWLFKLKVNDLSALQSFMTAAQYTELVGEE